MGKWPWVCCALVAGAAACGSGGGRDTGAVTTATTAQPTTGTSVGDDGGTGPKLDIGMSMDTPAATGGEECEAQTVAPEVGFKPVDVVLVVDTSDSMAAAITAVENSINGDFAAIMGASGLDYQIIVLGKYPPGGQQPICISAPLSGTDCNPPPAVPATTAQYQHYDAETGSGSLLNNIIAWYTVGDVHGLAPGGYSDWLRDDSTKVVLAMTDGNSASNSNADGDAFDNALLALVPPRFGTPGDRQYIFHTIIDMPVNNPPTDPWLPADPINGNGDSIQRVSVLSGGWRFPLSQSANFNVVFQQIAMGVVETIPLACSFPIPDPPAGETIDPDTIEIDYLPGGVGPAQAFHQVTGPGACTDDAFYIDNDTIFLCPGACAVIQADADAVLDMRFGCDTGFVPAE